MRDAMDPVELAKQAQEYAGGGERRGHGRWSREALVGGEQVDLLKRLIYVVTRFAGGKGPEPEPMPRPGVLTAQERARLIKPESIDRVLELEAMRKEHAERRKAAGLND